MENHDIRAAVVSVIDTLTPTQNSAESRAVGTLNTLLSGLPSLYTAATLETAAAIWESVLAMESAADDPRDKADASAQGRATVISSWRETIGTSHLRLYFLGFVDRLESDWQHVDTAGGTYPNGGQYGQAFDWEFVPDWLAANVDWTGDAPALREWNAGRAMLDMPDKLKLWLVDEVGAQLELMGGGAFGLRVINPNGWSVLITQLEGGGLPDFESWHVGVYPPGDDAEEATWNATSADSPPAPTFRQAVAAAQAMIADSVVPAAAVAPPPVAMTLGAPVPKVPAIMWERVGCAVETIQGGVASLRQLYEMEPALNDEQPKELADCYPSALEDWDADLTGALEALGELSGMPGGEG